jgi:SAM-dependent methyltransferase
MASLAQSPTRPPYSMVKITQGNTRVAQNIYDNDQFFANYSSLPRSRDGLAAAPEWPALQAFLPPVPGARVLDLGCGFGWFARWAIEAGAANVLGIDISANMLARALELTESDAITYRQGDLESLAMDEPPFDLVYSSLAFHYIEDFGKLARGMAEWLRPGGRLVFSVEHPIFTAPSTQEFIEGPDGRPAWPLNRYLDEGPRVTAWLAPGVVKYHRTIGTYVRDLVAAGLVVRDIVEWAPSPEAITEHPEWGENRERPPFLLVAADRP